LGKKETIKLQRSQMRSKKKKCTCDSSKKIAGHNRCPRGVVSDKNTKSMDV